ncbi:hypothetical protein FQ775_09045 [Nitratireductor mangrovi]|uniref:Thiol:disulfide interchange protein DsbD N-terminal domain-containing protein n=1 Tax=Nitratireductor mangrovi TaxID=2599600 RepID=A0A5B8KY15_9HYPH|nr:protein-disulfide reductase DsbD domain-containing protein [Nitratireductor mangrovi]QDZ00515.1 hypothetical protein FQ775_09045 [Nitratireductor mangrovi]
MNHTLPSTVFCLAATLCAAPAFASSSEAFHTDGATIRLVTAGLADAGGRLRGALEITLEPGWKTYWRDPGSSGVPPQIDLAGSLNVSGASLDFPAPQWHRDDYGAWAGYDRSVSLPVTFSVDAPDRYSLIEANVFLGVCDEVCVPVQASLVVEPGSHPDDPGDIATVAAAFGGLPEPARDGFTVSKAEIDGVSLRLEIDVPEGSDTLDIFLAGAGGYFFGVPERIGNREGPVAYQVPILGRPAGGDPVNIDFTLVAGARSVSGTFELP